MAIICENLRKNFGEKEVLNGFTCSFLEPGLTAVMGSSGSGKTTLMRLLLGLTKPDGGVISGMAGKRLSVVFQEDRLFPQLNVIQNAEISGKNGAMWLQKLGLSGEENTMPSSLSGGMARRVAIARALCHDGDVFLMDEPFKGLDEKNRKAAMDIFLRLKRSKKRQR